MTRKYVCQNWQIVLDRLLVSLKMSVIFLVEFNKTFENIADPSHFFIARACICHNMKRQFKQTNLEDIIFIYAYSYEYAYKYNFYIIYEYE